MIHRPVCVKCETEMEPEKNGVGVLDHASFGPYKIWMADMWQCPVCKVQIVIGFGHGPLAEHYEEEFTSHVDTFRQPGELLINNKEYHSNES
jgi:hypothetical protein